MGRPLLLLDVDGVLALRTPDVDGFEPHRVVSSIGDVHDLWLNPLHGVALTILAQVYDIAWATGWEHDAPRTLGPLLSIRVFPIVEFAQRPRIGIRLDKLPDIERLAADRPTAWIDDDPGTAGRRWARARQTPTLLIEPEPDVGIDARMSAAKSTSIEGSWPVAVARFHVCTSTSPVTKRSAATPRGLSVLDVFPSGAAGHHRAPSTGTARQKSGSIAVIDETVVPFLLAI
ncbi:MAG: hypothetical protein ACE367_14465 [Acidimicrobiales bacterium]